MQSAQLHTHTSSEIEKRAEGYPSSSTSQSHPSLLCSTHNLPSLSSPPLNRLCDSPSPTDTHKPPNWVGYGSGVSPLHVKLLSATIWNKTIWIHEYTPAWMKGFVSWDKERFSEIQKYEAVRSCGCHFIDSNSMCGLFLYSGCFYACTVTIVYSPRTSIWLVPSSDKNFTFRCFMSENIWSPGPK